MPETFFPTLAFGFQGTNGTAKLCQLWVGSQGSQDWRAVPDVSKTDTDRPQSVAGFVPEDEEGNA